MISPGGAQNEVAYVWTWNNKAAKKAGKAVNIQQGFSDLSFKDPKHISK